MADNSRSQQNLADRLAEILRKMERDGEDIHALARKVGEERRDLMRWAGGTTLPGHVLIALLDELPRHYADFLIGGTRLRLVCKEAPEKATALRAAAVTSSFVAEVAERMSDGEWCHRDDDAARDKARATITELQHFVGE
jgi:hypothetical protein